MSRTFKKFDGENEQREQYFRSEREESKHKKFPRRTPAHYLVDDDADDDFAMYPLADNFNKRED